MRKISILIGLTMLLLVGCQHNELFDKEITSIDVYERNIDSSYERGETVKTITSQGFIEELTNKLEKAGTSTTADIDIPGPDYWLVFKHDEEEMKQVGYYNEVQRFKHRAGRYIDWEGNDYYGVKTEIDFD